MRPQLLFFSALIMVVMSSCTQTYYLGRTPEALFTYPNANVTPLTKVRGVSSIKFNLIMPPGVSSRMISEAYSDALSKASGADVLINVDSYEKNTSILFLFKFSRYVVDGTSAKQEIGKQKLGK